MESNAFRESRDAGLLQPEHADDKFGQDQAETHMVKLVDGKLVPTADTESIAPDNLQNRYTNDEEQGLNAPNQKTYDLVDTSRGEGDDAPELVLDEMVPTTPSTPDPNNPVPAAPETPQPPYPPSPGPEIPDMPGTPRPSQPEITEPTEPGRSHEINNQDTARNSVTEQKGGQDTLTSGAPVDTTAGPRNPDEGMKVDPDTGRSARPYNEDDHDEDSYQPAERPQESAQMMNQPREAMDESLAKAGQLKENTSPEDPSDVKSTDRLDVKYNDPEAARQDVI